MLIRTFFLAPFSFVFGLISYFRNKLYDFQVFKSFSISVKSIVVGNLSVGGTGKTPHVYYIAKKISSKYNTAILSRGYGRKTKGYFEVFNESKANQVGDEPLLLKKRIGSNVIVAVCEDRHRGINILKDSHQPEIIILDDAFQHRKVKAGLNILLTEFNRPFYKDFPMPLGRLREFRSGKNRADIFIVTKCPNKLTNAQKEHFINNIGVSAENVFFSKIIYSSFQSFSLKQISTVKYILLVTAIADDLKIIELLSPVYSVKTFKFRDHHTFTKADIKKIHLKFDLLPSNESMILTTEKDFVKLKEFDEVANGNYPWYFLPIDIEVDREEEFNQILNNYVGTI
jgi:tetraacyldisaccharide 4'-kinase